MRDYRIAAVDKSLDILEFLGRQRREFGLPQMSKMLKIPKATLFRYMSTLEKRGYVRKHPEEETYSLGLKILELSNQVLDKLNLHEVVIPYMRKLQAQSQETVNLAVLEGHEIVYVEILESPRTFKMASHVGGREWLHTTSLGKAILSTLSEEEVDRIIQITGLPPRTPNSITCLTKLKEALAEVRECGYAVDDEENEIGARCVGAPIHDHRGVAIAAISISGPAFRSTPEETRAWGEALLEATCEISRKNGYLGSPVPPVSPRTS